VNTAPDQQPITADPISCSVGEEQPEMMVIGQWHISK